MHVSPAKYSNAWLPRKYDYRTNRWTDRRQTKWSLCAAMLRRRHKIQMPKNSISRHKNTIVDGETDGPLTNETGKQDGVCSAHEPQATQNDISCLNISTWCMLFFTSACGSVMGLPLYSSNTFTSWCWSEKYFKSHEYDKLFHQLILICKYGISEITLTS